MSKTTKIDMETQLRQAIADSGQSLNELGRAVGVDAGRLSRFMRGERDLTFAAASQLCEALGLQLVRVEMKAKTAKT